ncbi:MAG: hypothetical protein JRI96_16510, partial [Deltaproteobacteria bacterium]|nr:hypothetical protein [Deltaproteobacteria bacterium]
LEPEQEEVQDTTSSDSLPRLKYHIFQKRRWHSGTASVATTLILAGFVIGVVVPKWAVVLFGLVIGGIFGSIIFGLMWRGSRPGKGYLMVIALHLIGGFSLAWFFVALAEEGASIGEMVTMFLACLIAVIPPDIFMIRNSIKNRRLESAKSAQGATQKNMRLALNILRKKVWFADLFYIILRMKALDAVAAMVGLNDKLAIRENQRPILSLLDDSSIAIREKALKAKACFNLANPCLAGQEDEGKVKAIAQSSYTNKDVRKEAFHTLLSYVMADKSFATEENKRFYVSTMVDEHKGFDAFELSYKPAIVSGCRKISTTIPYMSEGTVRHLEGIYFDAMSMLRGLCAGSQQLIRAIILERLLKMSELKQLSEDNIARLRKELIDNIIPGIKVIEHLYKDTVPIGVEIHVRLDKCRMHDDFPLGGLVKLLTDIPVSTLLRGIDGDYQHLELRLQPGFLPITVLNILYYVKLGIIKPVNIQEEDESVFEFYPYYHTSIQDMLKEHTVTLLCLGYNLGILTQGIGKLLDRDIASLSHETTAYPGAYNYVGVTYDIYSGAELSCGQTNLFTQASLGYRDDRGKNFPYPIDLAWNVYFGTAILAYLRDEPSELKDIYRNFRTELPRCLKYLRIGRKDINRILAATYHYPRRPAFPCKFKRPYFIRAIISLEKAIKGNREQGSKINPLRELVRQTQERIKQAIFKDELSRHIADSVPANRMDIADIMPYLEEREHFGPEESASAQRLLEAASGKAAGKTKPDTSEDNPDEQQTMKDKGRKTRNEKGSALCAMLAVLASLPAVLAITPWQGFMVLIVSILLGLCVGVCLNRIFKVLNLSRNKDSAKSSTVYCQKDRGKISETQIRQRKEDEITYTEMRFKKYKQETKHGFYIRLAIGILTVLLVPLLLRSILLRVFAEMTEEQIKALKEIAIWNIGMVAFVAASIFLIWTVSWSFARDEELFYLKREREKRDPRALGVKKGEGKTSAYEKPAYAEFPGLMDVSNRGAVESAEIQQPYLADDARGSSYFRDVLMYRKAETAPNPCHFTTQERARMLHISIMYAEQRRWNFFPPEVEKYALLPVKLLAIMPEFSDKDLEPILLELEKILRPLPNQAYPAELSRASVILFSIKKLVKLRPNVDLTGNLRLTIGMIANDKAGAIKRTIDNWSTAEEHPDFVKNDPRKIAREILQMHDKRTTRKVTSLPWDRQTTKLPDELAAKLNLELSDDLLEYLQKIVAVVLCS